MLDALFSDWRKGALVGSVICAAGVAALGRKDGPLVLAMLAGLVVGSGAGLLIGWVGHETVVAAAAGGVAAAVGVLASIRTRYA